MSVEIRERDSRPDHRTWTALLDGRPSGPHLAVTLYEPDAHRVRQVHVKVASDGPITVHASIWLGSRAELVAARDVLAAAIDAWPEGT